MKVIRILVYEGEEEWVQSCLDSQRKVQGVFRSPKGTISEFYISAPIPFQTEPPELFKTKEILVPLGELLPGAWFTYCNKRFVVIEKPYMSTGRLVRETVVRGYGNGNNIKLPETLLVLREYA